MTSICRCPVAVFASVALGDRGAGVVRADLDARPSSARSAGSSQRGDGVLAQLQLTEAPSPRLKRFQQVVPKSPKEMTRLRRRLATAGYHSLTAAVFYALRRRCCRSSSACCRCSCSALAAGISRCSARRSGTCSRACGSAAQTAQRQKQIENGLPDALDLMIVCLEAGSGLDQAIVKTSDELDISHPALADELRLITTEMRAGKPRLEAFKNFAARTKVDDVRSLVRCWCRPTGSAPASRRRSGPTPSRRGRSAGSGPRSGPRRSASSWCSRSCSSCSRRSTS